MAEWNKFVGILQHFLCLSGSVWRRQEALLGESVAGLFCRALFSFSFFLLIFLYNLISAFGS